MRQDYSWVPWFRALVANILANGRDWLVDQTRSVHWGNDNPAILQHGAENVDPFSFLYFLAGYAGESRATLLRPVYESVHDKFDIGEEFPKACKENNLVIPAPSANFLFHDGKPSSTELLWNLFRHAADANSASEVRMSEDFADVLSIANAGVDKLTETLFLIDPEKFLPVDKQIIDPMSRYLDANFPQAEKSIEQDGYVGYKDIVSRIRRAFPGCHTYEIQAFLFHHGQEALVRPNPGVFQVSSNVFNERPPKDLWSQLSSGGSDGRRTFDENHCVYVGGPGNRPKYPLEYPKRGDVILVRTGNRQGKAIGIVEKNDYEDKRGFHEDAVIHVFWINKRQCHDLHSLPRIGFTRAGKTETIFRGADEYKRSFDLLDSLCDPVADTADKMQQVKPYFAPPGALNVILYGPPGTGKTYATADRCVDMCDGTIAGLSEEEVRDRYNSLVDQGPVHFITFHQSYGYEEFVEGLRPHAGDETTGFDLAPEDGVLKRIAEHARKSRHLPYVLVIDEINRANVSKVMGELITLLEEDKREGAANEIGVTLPHSRGRFTLPPNLHILGTMNTADRSIALLDTALRRRFTFKELAPDPDKLSNVDGVDLPKVLRAINERLEWLRDRDHLIGHAWFMSASDREGLDGVMRNDIIPLIAEYFYDDWRKVQAVLGGGNHFVRGRKLDPAPGLGDEAGDDRYRWTIRAAFDDDAYDRLISGSGAAKPGDDE